MAALSSPSPGPLPCAVAARVGLARAHERGLAPTREELQAATPMTGGRGQGPEDLVALVVTEAEEEEEEEEDVAVPAEEVEEEEEDAVTSKARRRQAGTRLLVGQ